MPFPSFHLVHNNGETLYRSDDHGAHPLFQLFQKQGKKLTVEPLASITDKDDAALALILVASPILLLEALTSKIFVQPSYLDSSPVSLEARDLMEIDSSTAEMRAFTYLRPGDRIEFGGHNDLRIVVSGLTGPTSAEDRDLQQAEVQVDSSIPGPGPDSDPAEGDENKASRNNRLSGNEVQVKQSMLESGNASNRSRTPTQASRGQTIQETPATNQRTIDVLARNRGRQCEISQLQDSDNREEQASNEDADDGDETDDENESREFREPIFKDDESQELTGHGLLFRRRRDLSGDANNAGSNHQTEGTVGEAEDKDSEAEDRWKSLRSPKDLEDSNVSNIRRQTMEDAARHQDTHDPGIHDQGSLHEHDFTLGRETSREVSQPFAIAHSSVSGPGDPNQQDKPHEDDNDLPELNVMLADKSTSSTPNQDQAKQTRNAAKVELPRAVSPIDEEETLPLRGSTIARNVRKRQSTNDQNEAPVSKKAKNSSFSTSKEGRLSAVKRNMKILPAKQESFTFKDDEDEVIVVAPPKIAVVVPYEDPTIKTSTPQHVRAPIKQGSTTKRPRATPWTSESPTASGVGTYDKPFTATRIAFSNSDLANKPEMAKFLSAKGFKIVERPNQKNFDTLVIGEVRKTSKLLLSLLLGKTIATDAWLVQSQRKSVILDPAQFPPRDISTTAGAPRNSLFAGKTILISPALKKDYGSAYHEIEELAKLAGAASVISKPYRAVKEAERAALVVLGLDKEDYEVGSFVEHGIDCFTRDLLSSSILRGHCDLDDDEFRILLRPSQGRKKGKSKARG